MSWKYTSFKKVQIFTQDVVFGAGFGILWSGFLAWAIHKFIVSANLILNISPWIGGITGSVVGGIAGTIFTRTTGITQEHEEALKVYGKASTLINRVVSTLMCMIGGYLFYGEYGLLVGGAIGLLLVSFIGNILSFFYFFIFGQVVNLLTNILGILRGGPFDKIFSLIGLFVDIPFKAIEFFLIKLKIVSKEKLTGITDAREHYDKGIKFDRRNKLKEANEEYEKALLLEPSFPEVYNNLAYNYGLLGEKEKEIKAYKEAIKLKSDYIKAMQNLTICYVEQNQDSEAKIWLSKLNELRPNSFTTDVNWMISKIRKEIGQN